VATAHRLDAARWSSRLLVGETREFRIHGQCIERHPKRGALFFCPDCSRRTRYLYAGGRSFGRYACRYCAGLPYPSQRLSRTKRRRLAAVRRRLGLDQRTLRAFLLAVERLELADIERHVARLSADLEQITACMARKQARRPPL
jgi:hypothetical protein